MRRSAGIISTPGCRWARWPERAGLLVIVTRHTSPTGFYGRNRHRERALHVNGRTANSPAPCCLSTSKVVRLSSPDRFPAQPAQPPGSCRIEFTRNQSMFVDRAFHARSGFPAAVHTYPLHRWTRSEGRNVNTHTHRRERERERDRERERVREKWGKKERERERARDWEEKEDRLHLSERVVVHKDSFRPLSSSIPTP